MNQEKQHKRKMPKLSEILKLKGKEQLEIGLDFKCLPPLALRDHPLLSVRESGFERSVNMVNKL